MKISLLGEYGDTHNCGERVGAEKICEDKGEKIHGEIKKKMREHSPYNLVSLVRALILLRPNK
jgi:hypothetical protein